MTAWAAQRGASVRLEWGPQAIEQLAGDVDCVVVFCGGLRNRRATARACAPFARILVVACGERWPDGSLRPALEDLVGAGGIVAALAPPDASPEARAAALAYEALGVQRRATLAECASARELAERGFGADVALCLDEDASDVAAGLAQDCFVAI